MLTAQTTMRVDVPNVVAADEQFNVTFIVEGDENPKDFSWSQGDDFQLVWGPQQGRSTSVQIINGKTTRSSQEDRKVHHSGCYGQTQGRETDYIRHCYGRGGRQQRLIFVWKGKSGRSPVIGPLFCRSDRG